MFVLQIVGYKNSGKTTLTAKLIEYFTSIGVRTASLKHHGHGGVPEGIGSTDSEKHRSAGSLIAGVEGDGLFQLSKKNWKLSEMIEIYKIMQVDLLLIEGFKKEKYPKIVLISQEEDFRLVEEVSNIKVVISRIPLTQNFCPFPLFHITEMERIYQWIWKEMRLKE